ncbi:hypothetical protein IHN32_15870 [Deinococcus sp. 14RED07]|uniref:hypothetical protein n=1 Tax=Deinococcus sp. 14RED07 TaxID=2745874 RepID=UPI001E520573|nr:hypothetical protein [Deinococcus sp. 14RED07]MCD0177419.1 hypothetical protein [Deinococcus sp. 14RED07]
MHTLPVHLHLNATRQHTVLIPPVQPAAERAVIGQIRVAASEHTLRSEVAAWYSVVTVPAQEADLILTPTPGGLPTVLSSLQGTLSYEHTPSLYGGAVVGSGGSGERNEPRVHTHSTLLTALSVLAERGEVTLGALGHLWAEYGALLRAYECAKQGRRQQQRAAALQLNALLDARDLPFLLTDHWERGLCVLTPFTDDLASQLAQWQLSTGGLWGAALTDLNRVTLAQLRTQQEVRLRHVPEGDAAWMRRGGTYQFHVVTAA